MDKNIEPILIVQHINIKWSKSSRGGRLAQHRSRIPKTYPLAKTPSQTVKNATCLIHYIEFNETNEFGTPHKEKILVCGHKEKYEMLNCILDPKSAQIHFAWSNGVPARTPNRTFSITSRTVTKIEYNARLASISDGNWHYVHEIIHATIAQPTTDLFLNIKPSMNFTGLQHLW